MPLALPATTSSNIRILSVRLFRRRRLAIASFDSGHNAQSIPGILPAGAAPIMGQLGREVAFKVTKAGLYGIECRPHFGMGMVALIQVGAGIPPNLSAARATSLPPLAARRMAPLLAQVR